MVLKMVVWEFGHWPSARRAMFIDAKRNEAALRQEGLALRQEGHVRR